MREGTNSGETQSRRFPARAVKEICASGALVSSSRTIERTEADKAFEEAWTRFEQLKKEMPHLNHDGTEPRPQNFGLNPVRAMIIEWRIRKEMKRTV